MQLVSDTQELDQIDVAPPGGLLAGAVVDLGEEGRPPTRRARQRLLAGAIAAGVFTGIAVISAAAGFGGADPSRGPAPTVRVAAQGTGVLLLRPEHDQVRIAHAEPVRGVAARADGAEAEYQLDQVAQVTGITSTGRIAAGRRTATSTVSIDRIDLLDGRVVLSNATLSASARSADGSASGALQLGPDTMLEVDGKTREVAPNERIAVEGVGTIIINEQAVLANAPTGDAQTGPRYRTVGAIAHLRITKDALGLQAGSELIIGRVDAAIREGSIRSIEHPGATGTADRVESPPVVPASTPIGLQQGQPKPGESTLPRRPVDVRADGAGVPSGALGAGYLFPVLGKASFTNDWGAPRASTGVAHQGTDIFAEEGTPIVAVADGVLDRVGWNSIGGYRFWLFDQYGNAFYHAHLSAYAPLALDGARVRRGDVIGFVGHTGDAQFTPPHLHFEVHPGNGDATNPFPLLNAWKQGTAVAIGLTSGGVERVAPLALLGFSDISANSGLGHGVLEHVPETHERSIEQETEPRPTADTLKGAIEGPGTSARQ